MDLNDLQMLTEAYQSVYEEPQTEDYETLVQFLASEGLVESYDEADELIEQMSDEDILGILDEAKVDSGLSRMEKTRKRDERFRANNPDLTKPAGPAGQTSFLRDILTHLARNRRGNVGGERLTGTTNRYSGYSGTRENENRAIPIRVKGSGPVRFFASRVTPTRKISGGRTTSMDMAKNMFVKDSYDAYDLVLGHLLDEGYADCVENAEVIMSNMSEEWVESILDEELINERLTRRRVNRAFNKFNDQNMNAERYRRPGETRNPRGIPNYTLIAAARHKEGSPNRYNTATSDDYRESGNRPTKRGGRGRKGEPKTGYYGTDRRDSDRGSGNAARRRASGR